jgi:hypothetical protein
MYEQKRDDFAVLLRRHGKVTKKWLAMSRQPMVAGKEVISVYKHNGDEGLRSVKLEFASHSFSSTYRCVPCQCNEAVEGENPGERKVSFEKEGKRFSPGRYFD